jgi:hypothetical protein
MNLTCVLDVDSKGALMGEILDRVWNNLVGRLTGPMNFRLLVQPAVAIFFAVRSGLKDAREGRPAFFWAILSKPAERSELIGQAWKDIGKIFLVAVALDVIYQIIVHRWIFPVETALTATLLAIVPYILVRGPVTRIARRILAPREAPTEPNNRSE